MKKLISKIFLRNPSKANYKFILKDWLPLYDLKFANQLLETKRFTRNLKPILVQVPDLKRVLILSAHTDDDVFGAGGTILKLSKSGAEIKTIYFANRYEGAEQTECVHNETLQVSKLLGTQPIFFNQLGSKIEITEEVIKKLSKEIIEFNPDGIFITHLLDDHDDHRRVNHLLALCAKSIPENCEIWSFQIYNTLIPNVVVDITDFIEQKKHLMGIWKSVNGQRNWAHFILGSNAMNCRYISDVRERYAEAFFVNNKQEFINLTKIYFNNPSDRLYYSDFYRKDNPPTII